MGIVIGEDTALFLAFGEKGRIVSGCRRRGVADETRLWHCHVSFFWLIMLPKTRSGPRVVMNHLYIFAKMH